MWNKHRVLWHASHYEAPRPFAVENTFAKELNGCRHGQNDQKTIDEHKYLYLVDYSNKQNGKMSKKCYFKKREKNAGRHRVEKKEYFVNEEV